MSALSDIIRASVDALAANAAELGRLDAQAGDGDLGVTATNVALAVTDTIDTTDDTESTALLTACGAAIARKAPSTAGTLLATGLLGAGRAGKTTEATGSAALAELLEAAYAAITARGKAEPGAKTMVDALRPACDAAQAAADAGQSIAEVLRAAAIAADEGAKATSTMVPRFGRAGWLAERSSGHEDAGARLVAIALAAAADATS